MTVRLRRGERPQRRANKWNDRMKRQVARFEFFTWGTSSLHTVTAWEVMVERCEQIKHPERRSYYAPKGGPSFEEFEALNPIEQCPEWCQCNICFMRFVE